MIKQNNISREFLDILVTDEEGTYTQSIEVDKNVSEILGVTLTSDRDDIMWQRGSFLLKINDEEFFPDTTEAKVLVHGTQIPSHARFFDFRKIIGKAIEPGNRKVELKVTDNPNAAADFEAYKVRLTVVGRIKEEA